MLGGGTHSFHSTAEISDGSVGIFGKSSDSIQTTMKPGSSLQFQRLAVTPPLLLESDGDQMDCGDNMPSISPLLMCNETLDDIDDDDTENPRIIMYEKEQEDEDSYDQDGNEIYRLQAAELTTNTTATTGGAVSYGGGLLNNIRPSAFSAFRPIQKPVGSQHILECFIRKMLDITQTKQQIIRVASIVSTNCGMDNNKAATSMDFPRWFHYIPNQSSPLISGWVPDNDGDKLLSADTNSTVINRRDRQRKLADKMCKPAADGRELKSESNFTPLAPPSASNDANLAPSEQFETIGELSGSKSIESPLRNRLFLHLIYVKLRYLAERQCGQSPFPPTNQKSTVTIDQDFQIPQEILSWWDRSGRWGML